MLPVTSNIPCIRIIPLQLEARRVSGISWRNGGLPIYSHRSSVLADLRSLQRKSQVIDQLHTAEATAEEISTFALALLLSRKRTDWPEGNALIRTVARLPEVHLSEVYGFLPSPITKRPKRESLSLPNACRCARIVAQGNRGHLWRFHVSKPSKRRLTAIY